MPSPQAHSNTSTFPTRKNAPPNGKQAFVQPETKCTRVQPRVHHQGLQRTLSSSVHRPTPRRIIITIRAALQHNSASTDSMPLQRRSHPRPHAAPRALQSTTPPHGTSRDATGTDHPAPRPLPFTATPVLAVSTPSACTHRVTSSSSIINFLLVMSSTTVLNVLSIFLSSSSTCPFIGPWELNYPMVLVHRTSALFVWLMGLNLPHRLRSSRTDLQRSHLRACSTIYTHGKTQLYNLTQRQIFSTT